MKHQDTSRRVSPQSVDPTSARQHREVSPQTQETHRSNRGTSVSIERNTQRERMRSQHVQGRRLHAASPRHSKGEAETNHGVGWGEENQQSKSPDLNDSRRPVLFGVSALRPCREGTTQRDLILVASVQRKENGMHTQQLM